MGRVLRPPGPEAFTWMYVIVARKKTMTLEQKTIGGVKWSGISQFMRIGTQVITSIILARLLLPEYFGLLGMTLVLMGLVAIFNDMEIGSAILQKQTGWYDQ